MGKRAGRKLTREAKIANPEIVCRKEIVKGIEAGESLYRIADRIKEKYPINKDQVLKMVMAEFDVVATENIEGWGIKSRAQSAPVESPAGSPAANSTGQAEHSPPVKHASLFHSHESFTG